MNDQNMTIKLYTNSIFLSQDKIETNNIRKIFYQMASSLDDRINNNFFNIFNDLDDLYQNGDSYANQVRAEAIRQGMEFLATHGIYDVTEQKFYTHFMSHYEKWDENFDVIASKYEAIIERTEQLDEYRTQRRKNRDKWVGLNSRGEGEAMAKNLTSNIAHGVFNLAAAGINAIGDSFKKKEIFKDHSTLNHVVDGLHTIVIAAFQATIDAVNSEIGNTFYSYSNEEISKVKAIVDSINSNRIPKDNILENLIKSVNIYPYNRDIYILLLSNFGDNDQSLDKAVDYFGLENLSNEKKNIFEKKRSIVALNSLEECKTNLPILEEYANYLGYNNFSEESKIILEKSIINEFKRKISSTDFSTVSACKKNIPILQEFANEIGYKGFEQESGEILNHAIERDFLLETSKYKFDSIKACKTHFPKLESFATEIGYTKFEEWSSEIQTKAKPKTTVIILVYLTVLVIGSWISHEPIGLSGFFICIFLFILGLISPKIVLWGGEKTRLRAAKIYGLLIFLSFIIGAIFIN